MAAVPQEDQRALCIDDVTCEELPWHDVRKVREEELKYLRDLGVYEKVDEKEAVAKYGITPVDTTWVDTDKAFEEERPCRSYHEVLREDSKVTISQICMQGLLHWRR